MNRRSFLISAAGIAVLAAGVGKGVMAMGFFGGKKDETKDFPYQLSKAEWKKKLSPEAYNVLREHGTERAFTSALNEEKRNGAYLCEGCDWPLFSSEHKFDSGTGWPSFWQPLNDKAVGTTTDYKLVYPRTEVHCANCGGHQGHVFEDGPEPTGLRYCINGVALKFEPKEA